MAGRGEAVSNCDKHNQIDPEDAVDPDACRELLRRETEARELADDPRNAFRTPGPL